MAQGSTTFHESEHLLTQDTRDLHRAIVSLMEELEAIEWYQQRFDAAPARSRRRPSDVRRNDRRQAAEPQAVCLLVS
jgi:hypothetical protein